MRIGLSGPTNTLDPATGQTASDYIPNILISGQLYRWNSKRVPELDLLASSKVSKDEGTFTQTLKAGLMEIADVFVVNKADRPGADRLRNDIELMLGLRGGQARKDTPAHHGVNLRGLSAPREGEAHPVAEGAERGRQPVLRAVGTTGEGLPEMLASPKWRRKTPPSRLMWLRGVFYKIIYRHT